MFAIPIVFGIVSKYGLIAAGRLTNFILKYKFNVQSALPIYVTGAIGLIVFIIIIFGWFLIIRSFWNQTGKLMEWYDREQEQREIARERTRNLRRTLPGGEALRHPVNPHPIHSPRSDMLANFIQQRMNREEEEQDEDRAYRQRIGVQE